MQTPSTCNLNRKSANSRSASQSFLYLTTQQATTSQSKIDNGQYCVVHVYVIYTPILNLKSLDVSPTIWKTFVPDLLLKRFHLLPLLLKLYSGGTWVGLTNVCLNFSFQLYSLSLLCLDFTVTFLFYIWTMLVMPSFTAFVKLGEIYMQCWEEMGR